METIQSFGIPVTALDLEEATRATVIKGLQEHSLAHFNMPPECITLPKVPF